MHKKSSLLAALGLSCALAAQTSTRPEGLEILPGRTSGTTSGITAVTRVAGAFPSFEALQGYDNRYHQGLGDLTNTTRAKVANKKDACEIDTVVIAYQDQNGATQEGFKVVARPAVARSTTTPFNTPLPDLTAAALFTQTVPGSAPTAGGPAGFLYQVQFMTTSGRTAIPNPCDDTFYFGMEVPLVPTGQTWPTTDGLGITTSYWDTIVNSPSNTYDWPKGGHAAPALYVLNITSGTTGLGRFADNLNFGYNLVPDAPVLQVAARHKNSTSRHGSDNGYGAAGVFPEADPTTARGLQSTDGITVRFTDNKVSATQSGIWFLAASVGSARGPDGLNVPLFPLPGIGGRFYLSPVYFGPVSGVLGISADTEIVLFPSGTVPTSVLGARVHLQGLTDVKNQMPHFTNLVAVNFQK